MPHLANSAAQPVLHLFQMMSPWNRLGVPSPCASIVEVICTLLVTQARYKSRHPMQPSDPRRWPLRRNTQQAQSCMQRHNRHLVPDTWYRPKLSTVGCIHLQRQRPQIRTELTNAVISFFDIAWNFARVSYSFTRFGQSLVLFQILLIQCNVFLLPSTATANDQQYIRLTLS